MSRIGKQPVLIPSGVDVTIDGQNVSVKGPKGTLVLDVAEPMEVSRNDDGAIVVTRPNDERRNRSLHGLSRTLIANLVTGVTEGYTTKMEIFGVGYRVVAKGSDLEFALGYSHPVLISAPEGVTFASAGNGTSGHLAGELLAQRLGGKMIHVPYKEGAVAMTAVMSSQVDFMFYHPAAVMPQIRAGKLRALAASSAVRSAAASDVPTLMEQGVADFDLVAWFMLYAPAATPAATLAQLRSATAEIGRAHV